MRRAGIVLAITLGGCAFEGSALDFTIDPDATTRCERTFALEELTHVRCDHATVTIATGAFGLSAREVHLMHPVGAPPASGWPAAILFQGSFHSAEGFFEGDASDDFGGLHQANLVASLLEAGFVVIAPEARYDGATYWDTNVLPWAIAWDESEDHQLMVELFAAIDGGGLGPIDGARLFATGISSGGYMTSRMAVSYPGRFRALAIASASYATCSGPLCDVPALPADHPPTLFLHGREDLVVPLATARAYATALDEQETPTRLVVDDASGHEWTRRAPVEIVDWFSAP
ncbi:MAG: prolyl oligopeptidase family serine peptidase [Myxococcales bacterium]|nr:prolyl oligopeptidase family serine peptidase [Myxococcales bacterium]